MNPIHWLAIVGEFVTAAVFVAAGCLGLYRWRIAGGWLLIAGGVLGLLGSFCLMAYPAFIDGIGQQPLPYRDSRIQAICHVFQASGWLLGAAGALIAVRVLRTSIERCEMLAEIRAETEIPRVNPASD